MKSSGWTGFRRWPRCRRSAGRFSAPLHHYSTPQDHTPALALHAAQSDPLDARAAGLGHSRARPATSASELTEQDYSLGLAGPRDGQPFENRFSGLDAGGLLDDFPPPPLQHLVLATAFDLLLLQPSSPLQSCRRPQLMSATCAPCLFRVLRLSLVLQCQRAKIRPVIFFPRHVQ